MHGKRIVSCTVALTYISLVLLASIFLALDALRRYLVRNPLDNVPGPPPISILTGTHILINTPKILTESRYIGDMGVLFHRHKGWDFLKKLEGYARVSLLQALLEHRMYSFQS